MSKVQDAIREWDADVDAVFVQLVNDGVPPLIARQRAAAVVSRRRGAVLPRWQRSET